MVGSNNSRQTLHYPLDLEIPYIGARQRARVRSTELKLCGEDARAQTGSHL